MEEKAGGLAGRWHIDPNVTVDGLDVPQWSSGKRLGNGYISQKYSELKFPLMFTLFDSLLSII